MTFREYLTESLDSEIKKLTNNYKKYNEGDNDPKSDNWGCGIEFGKETIKGVDLITLKSKCAKNLTAVYDDMKKNGYKMYDIITSGYNVVGYYIHPKGR